MNHSLEKNLTQLFYPYQSKESLFSSLVYKISRVALLKSFPSHYYITIEARLDIHSHIFVLNSFAFSSSVTICEEIVPEEL